MLRNQKQHGICEKKDIQEKDGYKFALLSDRELEWFDTSVKLEKLSAQTHDVSYFFFYFIFFFDIMRYIR